MIFKKPFTINDEVNLPLMSHGSMASPIHKLIAHGVGKVLFSFNEYHLKESFRLSFYCGIFLFLFAVK